MTDGLESAVSQANEAAGDATVSVAGGGSTIRQCLEARPLGELQIHLVPVLLGDGIRLFERSDGVQTELERTRVVESADVTHLRFRVPRYWYEFTDSKRIESNAARGASSMTDTSSTDGRRITVRRVLEVPPDWVYDAFIDPDAVTE